MAGGTESNSGELHVGEDISKDKLSQSQRQHPTTSATWRPGRRPENVELNLGLRATRSTQGEAAMDVDDPGAYESKPDGSPSLQQRPIPNQGQSSTSSRHTRRPIPPDWEPPLAVGASLGEGLSYLEEADRLVVQWEAILKNARETQPNADLSPFERQLEKVTRERDEMEESEENTVPAHELESTKRERIAGRIDDLEEALERTPSEAGKANIRAAIDAYKDGRIPCWDKWTLIYAGRVVDHCPTYESFTVDRHERLDRYFEDHGEGWLWFERPLAPKSNTQPEHLLAATWANPSKHRFDGWNGPPDITNITMGFRRVRIFHSRQTRPKDTQSDMSESRRVPAKPDASVGKPFRFKPKHTGMSKAEMEGMRWSVYDDQHAPRCFFLMHLDSGASIPSLHRCDLPMLGIDLNTYAPQSDMTMGVVGGEIRAPILEMRVDVCRHNGQSLVGVDPVWPKERRELGGIIPVSILPDPKGSCASRNGLTAEELKIRQQRGEDISEKTLANRENRHNETRLSGMVPFQVCYHTGVPGKPIWFGEDRRDVLTTDRMPGQYRFEWHKSLLVPKSREIRRWPKETRSRPEVRSRPESQKRPEAQKRPETQKSPETHRSPETRKPPEIRRWPKETRSRPETQRPLVSARPSERPTAIVSKHEINPQDKKRKRLPRDVERPDRVQRPRRN
ncbi:hypothetical protein QQZ08_005968 [Neonectria magnoliae]|uniref:Uncharacterized protein n=1 Tax=Neonectria magnoliae TaxID=2732573 RepID=A0ABR1I1Z8_9HYPO